MDAFTQISLLLGATVMGIAALWHVYWATGGQIGLGTAIPERISADGKPEGVALFTPSRLATLVVAIGIGALAGLYGLLATGLFGGTSTARATSLAVGVVGAIFLRRAVGDFGYVGFFKRRTGTAFARVDSLYYSPLCLFLGLTGLSAAVPAIDQLIG